MSKSSDFRNRHAAPRFFSAVVLVALLTGVSLTAWAGEDRIAPSGAILHDDIISGGGVFVSAGGHVIHSAVGQVAVGISPLGTGAARINHGWPGINKAPLTLTDPTPASAYIYTATHQLDVTASGGDGNFTFTWEYDADGFGTGAASVVLANGGTLPNGQTDVTISNPGGPYNSRLALSDVTPSGSGFFRCTLSDTSPEPDVVSAVAQLQMRNAVGVTVSPTAASRKNYIDALTLTATATGGFGNLNYQWQLDTSGTGTSFVDLADGPVTVSRPGYDPAVPGSYTVNVTYTVSGATSNVLGIDHVLDLVHDGIFRCVVEDEQYPLQGLPQGTANVQAPVIVADQIAIVRNPSGGSYYNGNTHQMDVVATGGWPSAGTPYTFQWYYGNLPSAVNLIQSATQNPFSFTARSVIPVPPPANYQWPSLTGYSGYYRVNVSFSPLGSNGGAGSQSTQVIVRDAVNLTTTPQDQTKNVTESVTFDVAAAGGYPAPGGYVYQWKWNVTPLSNGAHPSGTGSTVTINPATGSLTISNLGELDAGVYEVSASDANAPCPALNNKCTAVDTAVLTVTNNIVVTDDPDSMDVYVGDTANFTVAADGGDPPYTYTWYWDFEGNPLPGGVLVENGAHPSGSGASVTGATGATLSISGVQLGVSPQTSDAGEYYCVVSDSSGENLAGTSGRAILGVYAPVRFTSSPASVTRWTGGSAPFSVVVGGGMLGQRSLRWQVNAGSGFTDVSDGPNISGATTVTLTVSGLVLADNGKLYRCVATSGASDDPFSPSSNTTHTSGNATLTVAAELTINDQPADVEAYVSDPAFTLRTHFEGGIAPYASDWRRTGVSPAVPETSAGAGSLQFGTPNTALLSVAPGALGAGLYDYAVNISDGVGSKRSEPGQVTIANDLAFSKPLENAAVRRKQVFTWEVEVTGGLGDLHFQWYKEVGGSKSFEPVPEDALHVGTQTASLRFNEIADSDAGVYMVEVNDTYSSVNTQAEMVVGTALPLTGGLGLAALAFASALTGAFGLRRRR